jgi:hypothetical protein
MSTIELRIEMKINKNIVRCPFFFTSIVRNGEYEYRACFERGRESDRSAIDGANVFSVHGDITNERGRGQRKEVPTLDHRMGWMR